MDLKEHIFHVCSLEEFFERYFEKEALFIPSRNRNKSAKLFDFHDLDSILTTNKLVYPSLKIFKDGEELPKSAFEKREESRPFSYADIPKSIEYFAKGYSLILNRIDHLDSKLNLSSRALESDLKMEAQVNLYLTPSNNFGFDIHYDAHDVFILQLEGTKNWTLYDSDIPLVTDQLPIKKRDQESFIEESKYLLTPGDVLYIPRGKYHQAKSTSDTSMHLTIGIFPLIGYQLLQQLAVKCQDDLFFRKSVPMESASEQAKRDYYQLFIEKLNNLLNPTLIEQAVNHGRQRLLKQQDLNFKGVFLNQLQIDSLNEQSVIRMRSGVNAKIRESKRILKICMPQQIIDLPIFVSPLVKQVLSKEEIAVSSIQGIGTTEQKIQLLKRLITQGLIEIVKP
jgi:ribosomal protein L16 Arg81 hydroxylase